MPTALHNK